MVKLVIWFCGWLLTASSWAAPASSDPTQMFDEFFQRHGSVMLLVDPVTGRIVAANPAAADFYGFTQPQLMAMSIQDINTLSPAQVEQERAEAAREGRNYFIFRHRLADASVRTVEVRSHPLAFGDRVLLVSVINDITPGRNLEHGMWHYQQRLEELVQQRSDELAQSHRLRLLLLLAALFVACVLIAGLFFLNRRAAQAEAGALASTLALREREALFGALFQQSGLLAAVLDKQGRVQQLNAEAQALIRLLTQQEPKTMIGQVFTDVPIWQRPQDRARLKQAIQRASEGQTEVFDAVHIMPDGTSRDIEVQATPVVANKLALVFLTGVNVTERHQLRRALEQERWRLRSILDGTHVGTWEWNVQTGEITFNERWAEILGHTLADLEPVSMATWRGLIHPDELDRVDAALQAHFAGETEFFDIEMRMRHRQGLWVWVHCRGRVASHTPEGKPWMMAGTHQDITARVQAEHELKQSQETLQEALHTIGEAFVLYDEDDRLLLCNDQYRKAYPAVADLMKPGIRFETLIRTWVERVPSITQGEDPQRWVARRLKAHQEGQLVIQQAEMGRWFKIFERKTPRGMTTGFRVDITELVQARQAAEAANVSKSRFLATMSHELRTPMNGMLGMAQLLMSAPLSEAQTREYAKTIYQSGQALLTLLNDILDLSKIESGKLTLEKGRVRPVDLLRDIRALFQISAEQKGLKLNVRWRGRGNPTFMGDPHRIRQMLTNLVNNAIKFTESGEITVEANAIASDNGPWQLAFSVTDTGIGIEQSQLGRLFQPFSQVDNSTTRQYGGSGLGLSIVSQLAKAMGGRSGVESAPGQGSRFWFEWPAEPLTDVPAPNPVPSPEAAPQAGPLQGHVLVAEDNRINREVICAILSQLGLTFDAVENGQLALDAMRAQPTRYDAVLMDVQMPVMDGCAATTALRQHESKHQLRRLPVIALTADAFPEDQARCLQAGMDVHLAKPVHIETLTQVLKQRLDKGAG